MPQQMPVVREVYRPGLVPQFAAILALCAVVHLCAPRASFLTVAIIAPLIYLLYCRLARALLTRDHIRGMQSYRQGRFEEAISHFDASHRFFSAHQRLDVWRSLAFGVASRNPYRLIALGNMAYCFGQLGDRAKAVELYERVLQEAPDHAVAKASLNMLQAGSPPSAAA